MNDFFNDFFKNLRDMGIIISLSDGIVGIKGLTDVCYGEMITFCNTPNKDVGLVLNLELGRIGAVVLGNDSFIFPGDYVSRNYVLMNVPTGDYLLGRVVDPLGHPIDGLQDFSQENSIFFE
jgi:F-type H+-transporting ATPase subunit alpha